MRIVLDTVVFVRSLINPNGACAGILLAAGDGYTIFLSELVLVEILEVLQRPKLVRKYHPDIGRHPERIFQILSAATVVPLSSVPSISRDPKDDKFLATALAASADYLVSEDFDLLDLGEYEGIPIITCQALLAVLQAKGSNQ